MQPVSVMGELDRYLDHAVAALAAAGLPRAAERLESARPASHTALSESAERILDALAGEGLERPVAALPAPGLAGEGRESVEKLAAICRIILGVQPG